MRQRGRNTEYIIAFPLQQWLRERSTVLRNTYIVCLVSNISGTVLRSGTVFAKSTAQMVMPIARFFSVTQSAIVFKKGAQLRNLICCCIVCYSLLNRSDCLSQRWDCQGFIV
jgi:hypothetical protein